MSVDLIAFRKKFTYESHGPVSAIVADLKQMAEVDKIIEKQQRRVTLTMVGCIMGAIALFIFMGVISEEGESIATGYVVFLGLLVLGAIVAGMVRSRYVKVNIPNYRYLLVPKLLGMVARDMDRQAPIKTYLVLSPPLRKEKCVYTGSHSYRKGWKMWRYADTWLTLEGTFLDRTQFRFVCTDLWVTVSGRKRGRSGKMKHKTKSKPKGFELCLSLRVPRKTYGALPVLTPEAQAAVRLPDHCTLKQLEINDNRLFLRIKTASLGNDPDSNVNGLYKITALMFLSAYQILNLAQALSKSKAQA